MALSSCLKRTQTLAFPNLSTLFSYSLGVVKCYFQGTNYSIFWNVFPLGGKKKSLKYHSERLLQLSRKSCWCLMGSFGKTIYLDKYQLLTSSFPSPFPNWLLSPRDSYIREFSFTWGLLCFWNYILPLETNKAVKFCVNCSGFENDWFCKQRIWLDMVNKHHSSWSNLEYCKTSEKKKKKLQEKKARCPAIDYKEKKKKKPQKVS